MNRKKIIALSVVVILLITAVITFSYAFWGMTNEQTTMNKLTSGCLSIELVGEDAISLNNSFPITDEEGMALKPYSFTITNTCDLFVSYNVSLEILNGSTLPIKYVRSMINKEAVVNLNSLESTTTSISGSIDSKILTTGSLGSGDSADYTLRIWMDENVTLSNTDAINKSLQSKVVVTAVPSSYSPVANGFTLLNEALLVNEYQTTDIDVAKNKIASKQAVDLTKTAPLIDWKSIIKSTSDQVTVTKADPALIGQYGITDNITKIRFSNSYTYDSETAYYKLSDRIYLLPTEIDYSSGNYYFCSSTITMSSNNTVETWDAPDCSVFYRVTGVDSVSDTSVTLSSGTKINAKKYVLNVITYDSQQLESDKSDKGLYTAPDDFGTTYYYRGNVTNNYVKFANFYWKVIRINGDGSIRMIYAGVNADSNSTDQSIGTSYFNSLTNDPTYVGYMYSKTLGVSYENTIKNDNNSTIKTKIDNWYKTNILDKGYSSYIADGGFCNDRSLDPNETGNGYDTLTTTNYLARTRLFDGTPTMLCPNSSNDLFTLVGNSNGNGALTYPVGLITSDEMMYAGFVYKKLNPINYLSTEFNYFTMTPYSQYVAANVSRVIMFTAQSGLLQNSNVNSSRHIRPVINLKADTVISSGIGTKNNPFIVK